MEVFHIASLDQPKKNGEIPNARQMEPCCEVRTLVEGRIY